MLLSKAKNLKMQEIRQFIPVSVSTDFDSLSPHIANAERDYLIPVIGQDTYDALQAFYDGIIKHTSGSADTKGSSASVDSCASAGSFGSGSSSGSNGSSSGGCDENELMAELLSLVQSSVAHIAFWIGYYLLNVHITDAGFRRLETETVKGLFKYQEDNLKAYFRINGFNRLDTVLQFLEDHAQIFQHFAQSDQYTVIKSSFIPNTSAFNRIVFINGSRLTFLRMVPHIQLIEEMEIQPILGPIAMAELRDEMLKDAPREMIVSIIPIIQRAIAFLASAMLMEESGADLKDNGLYFTSSAVISNNNTEEKPSDAIRINILVQRNRAVGNVYLEQIRSYLIAHASEWSDVIPSSGRILRRDNTDKKTFWV